MLYGMLAEAVVLLHLGFVLFVIFGGLLAFRWRRAPWFHLPAAAWGALIEFAGWICPLTPLENWLRRLGGQSGYQGGFVEHYILPVLYPRGLTRNVQVLLGTLVVLFNLAIYLMLRRRGRPPRDT
ncbi:MAG TPA: DUF2784 domain-containing protein [Gemmatimonadales bacterium]|jgi:hypothetical protein|nr:DUF2784 domain-containing protein [Gemmatimonadales bacterium]